MGTGDKLTELEVAAKLDEFIRAENITWINAIRVSRASPVSSVGW